MSAKAAPTSRDGASRIVAMRVSALLLLIVLVSVGAAACGGDDAFIGIWKESKGAVTIEIKKGVADDQYDLVFSTAQASPGSKARFTLTGVRKGDAIELSDPTGQTQQVAKVTVSGDTLTITSNNEVKTYDRAE
jgi:hypothetical protein